MRARCSRDEGRRKGSGKKGNEGRRRGLSWAGTSYSEPKLLPVIHALLTTTGCGLQPRRPQPMGVAVFSVNEFVVRNTLIFLSSFGLRKAVKVHPQARAPLARNSPRKMPPKRPAKPPAEWRCGIQGGGRKFVSLVPGHDGFPADFPRKFSGTYVPKKSPRRWLTHSSPTIQPPRD
jgi:hypothetical protein